jgi:hypothetical protein
MQNNKKGRFRNIGYLRVSNLNTKRLTFIVFWDQELVNSRFNLGPQNPISQNTNTKRVA